MQKLPESELDIMLVIWETDGKPVPRTYFDEKLACKNWSVNALNSFLFRLEERGFLKATKDGNKKYYSALIKQEDYVSREGKNILKKLYNGSIKNFLLSVTSQEELDETEINELQAYLQKLKEDSK